MTLQTCFGLDNDKNTWLLVQRNEGKTVFLQSFKNTLEGLNELSKFIINQSDKPKICIKSTGGTAFVLLKILCGIPNIEVMFVSPAGFRQYQTCLPKNRVQNSVAISYEAEMLANCAEHMI
jgi:hypothetical protein